MELRVTAMYFSATGTTEKVCRTVAERIAAGLSAAAPDVYDFTLPEKRRQAPEFGENDVVVFGTPVYAGRVPNVLLDYVKSVRFRGSIAVPVVLFGNRDFDDALLELSETLSDGGAVIAGAGAFVGEHAFSTVLAKGRPDEEDLGKAGELAAVVAERIRNAGGAAGVEEPEIPGEDPIRPYYRPRDSKGNFIDIRKVTPVTGSSCDGCGLCADVCPMGSIDPDDVTKLTGICIKCCACVKKCPRGAKYFDDKGFLYHKEELEKMYERRADSRIFV